MTQTNTEDLVTNEVKGYLEDFLKKLCMKNYTLDVSAGSIKGDNYLGIIAKVQVKGEDKNGKNTTLNLIVKSAPRNEAFRSVAPVRNAYDREIYMYSKVLPEFTKLQEDRGILKPFKSFAKYYESTMNNLNEALIMENMKEIGFELSNRHKPLDYNHVLMVLKEYGKFHALSYAMRDQQPDLFKELGDNTQESFFTGMKNDEMNKGIRHQSEKALNALDPVKHKVAYEKFKNFQEKMVDLLHEAVKCKPAGKYAVIGHGDCWVNNMLFKYGNPAKPQCPTEMCFLDWQLSRLGSPALDLSYFIFTATDKNLRDEHYDTLIIEYYESLSSFLRRLGSDPDKLFPFEVLQEHLKKFSVYGLYMSVMLLFFMTSEVEEIPDLHNMSDADDVMSKFQFDSKNVEKYNERIRGVILDYVRSHSYLHVILGECLSMMEDYRDLQAIFLPLEQAIITNTAPKRLYVTRIM